jgi:iron complex outermembrane receptor protein
MNINNKSIFGAFIVASTLTGMQAHAQSSGAASAAATPAPPPVAAIEEVVVTGTHIVGTAKNTTVAVDVINAADLRNRGTLSPVELVKSLPYVTGGDNGDNNQGTSSARYVGAANINLRGLSNASTNGFDRTLVLFNGQRIAPYFQTALTMVDVNTVPLAAVGRVEILKDGGSTAYGSDAIAGVVNFITSKTLNSFDVGADYQYLSGSTGGNWNGHVNWGKVFDQGNVLLSVGYNHTSQLPTTARSWVVQPILTNPQNYVRSSNAGPYTLVTPGSASATSFTDPGCSGLGGILSPLSVAIPSAGAAPICYQSRAPYFNLIDQTDRAQLYGEANYQLTDDIKLHFDAWYAMTSVPSSRYSPENSSPIYFPTLADDGGVNNPYLFNPTGSKVYPGVATTYYIPGSNPGLRDLTSRYSAAQLGLTAAQYAALLTNGVNTSATWQALGLGGNPITGGATKLQDYFHTFRLSGGAEGRVLNDINWTTHLTYGEYFAENQYPDFVTQRVELALRGLGGSNCNVAANTPGANGCQYLNPFTTAFPTNTVTGAANPGYVGHPNDPALVKWMMDPNQLNNTSRLFTGEFGFSGKAPHLSLPGGQISWAAGVQYRWNQMIADPQGLANSAVAPCTDLGVPASACPQAQVGPLAFFGVAPTQTFTQASTGEYVELRLPVLSNLELQLAGRREQDSAGHITNDPKIAGRWQAMPWLAFRATRESTFHAPLPLQLDQANGQGGSTVVNGTRVKLTTYGNSGLKPETSTNYDFGLILTPPGFVATVDYWSYKLKNQITTEPVGSYSSALFPGGATGANRCGDPAYAVLQSRFSFNSGGCSINNITAVTNGFINGPTINTSGVDFDVTYKHPLWDGQLTLSTNATWAINFSQANQYLTGTTTPILILASYNQVGKFNGGSAGTAIVSYGRPMPAWRDMTTIAYAKDNWSVRWITHYVSGIADNRVGFGSIDPTAQVAGYPTPTNITNWLTIKQQFIHDIAGTYGAPGNWQVTLAVTNLFDRPPPLARTELSFSPDISSAFGRVIRMGVQKTF